MKEFSFLKRNNVIILLLVFIFSLFFISIAMQVKSQWAQDSHWHMSLVENLASGKGYSTDGMFPHGKYPPGLAFLILPFYLVLHDINLAGLFLIYICSVLSIVLLYKLSLDLFSKKIAIISSLFLIFHNLFLFNSVSIMTETPFMLFSLACIYFFMKSFDKSIFSFPALISFAIAVLVRYDGVFLIFPLIFYTYFRIFDLRNLLFSRNFILSICISLGILSLWFLRNLFQFGSLIYSDYTRELTSFSIKEFFSFILLFFKTGYLFPLLAVIGLVLCIIKYRKDSRVSTLVVWFITYVLLHCIWSARTLRFYGEILLLLCLFSSIAVIEISNMSFIKKFGKIFIFLVVGLIIAEQLFIFYSGSINYETTTVTLNRYESIAQVSAWANMNLPSNATYAVTDVAVYSIYLNNPSIVYFNQGVDLLLGNKGQIYFLTDTLHPWATSTILAGLEKKDISFQFTDSKNQVKVIHLTPKILNEVNYKNKSKAILFEINNISVTDS